MLLLDEPTAGLDPCSRHHVWSLLRERRAGRVILVATQSMEEADTQAGEPRLAPWGAHQGFAGYSPRVGPTAARLVLAGHVLSDSDHQAKLAKG